jgi:hypothetical protein
VPVSSFASYDPEEMLTSVRPHVSNREPLGRFLNINNKDVIRLETNPNGYNFSNVAGMRIYEVGLPKVQVQKSGEYDKHTGNASL